MAEYLERRGGAPLKNVWLGTSVENQKVASRIEVLRKCDAVIRFISFEPLIGSVGKLDLSEITWAIVGGESGPRARALNSEWVEQVLLQCEEQGVRFFFKQWGGVNKKKTGRVFKGRTWDEMPDAPVVQFK
jgi:protein gp37